MPDILDLPDTRPAPVDVVSDASRPDATSPDTTRPDATLPPSDFPNLPDCEEATYGCLNALSFTAGPTHLCALERGKTRVSCAGPNHARQVQPKADTVVTLDKWKQVALPTQPNDEPFTLLSAAAGLEHSCVLAEDMWQNRHIFCWGKPAGFGEQPSQDPSEIYTLDSGSSLSFKSVRALSAGRTHTCGIMERTALCWGVNTRGQFGAGAIGETLKPFKSAATLNNTTHMLQFSTKWDHGCAIAASWEPSSDEPVRAYCWGENKDGQTLPSSGDSSYRSPQLIPVLAETTPDFPRTYLQVAAGYDHTCAIASASASDAGSPGQGTAEVYCWGAKRSEPPRPKLGTRHDILGPNTAYPVKDIDGAPIRAKALALGEDFSCAITLAETIVCWGKGRFAQSSHLESFSGLIRPWSSEESRSKPCGARTGIDAMCRYVLE